MKLVRMPVDLIHVTIDDLPNLGVDASLLGQTRELLADMTGATESLAIFGPPELGTRELLMVVCRTVGAALRDENIRLRDGGGDLKAGRKKLCYLPGEELPTLLRSSAARRPIEGEAACFIQDADAAWRAPDGEPLAPQTLLDLLDTRLAAGRPTFLSADPAMLPVSLEQWLRARLHIIEPAER